MNNDGESARRGVMIYYDMIANFRRLSNEQMGELMFAFLDYSSGGPEPELTDPAVAVAFGFMKLFDDFDRAKYEAIVEKKRAAGKKGAEARWKAGS